MMRRLERRHQPLAPRRVFVQRVLLYVSFSIVIIVCSLGIGILGYHFTEHLSWLDSLLNASMILGGMGPVDAIRTDAGKLFASFYALFAGMVFLVAVGVVFAPIVHRFLHSFHVAPDDVVEAENEEKTDDGRQGKPAEKQELRSLSSRPPGRKR
jgi:cytochrome c biogenesis protein CcdA